MTNDLRENVRKTALQVIEEEGIVFNTDISKKLEISGASAALYLHKNYRNWTLGRENIAFHHSQQKWAYYRTGTNDNAYLIKRSEALEKARDELALKAREKSRHKIHDEEINQRTDYLDFDRSKTRELVKQTSYQIIDGVSDGKKKLLVRSDEISDKIGIDQLRAGLILSRYREEWGLGRTNVSPYHKQNIWAYFRKAENGSIGADNQTAIDELKEKLIKEKEERKAAKQRELIERRSQRSIRKKETLTQRIDRMIDKLHKEKERVDLTDIRLQLRWELGRYPNSDEIAKALDRYEKGIKKGRYVWKGGYSIMPE